MHLVEISVFQISFIMTTTDRKRKRETNEQETTITMDTEQNSSVQFPQINPTELKVEIRKIINFNFFSLLFKGAN